MAEETNSTPPGAFTRRFLATAAARVSTFAAAGGPLRREVSRRNGRGARQRPRPVLSSGTIS